VANNGNVFVADGYCNARVVEFTPEGGYLGEFELPAEAGGPMRVPHSVVRPAAPRLRWAARASCAEAPVGEPGPWRLSASGHAQAASRGAAPCMLF